MRLIVCLITTFGLGVCLRGGAQEVPAEERITVKVQGAPLRAALKQMFERTSLKYRVDPGVPDAPVNVNIRDVSPAALLRIVVRHLSAGKVAPDLCLVREGGIYVLKLDPEMRAKQRAEERANELAEELRREPPTLVTAEFRDPRLERKFTGSFKRRKLREIADALFAGTGCQYTFTGKSNELVLSLELKNVSLLEGLRQLTAAAARLRPGVGLWRSNDVYRLGPKTWEVRPDQP